MIIPFIHNFAFSFCLLCSMATTWESAMESSCFYHKVDLESIVINEDILMCHTAAVWKEAVGLLWPKEYQQ